ncbi:M1 family metallopeptidase [Streptomyces griseorubiginosus]|uniref:M1 family metallopeptidase n=1 Tax=Streptomyces griseorubiginosus TaxID=67304 RepID=UPI002E804F8F|nr:M1 family metallopeptidase [Streptomyces griseorubiginosus]WUB49353.1 M1 family metallopeptidase [Streptomyces griseorubiginosus]WUB57882.1 M1 family metallopeptidase [Streptomyces griseorubiginosus]
MPKAVRRTFVLVTTPVTLVALLGAAAPPSTGSPGVGDPYFPLAGNGGYHVEHYGLTLGYDPASRHLDGRAVLTARATQRLTRFDLDFKGLTVTALTVGHTKAAFRRDGQELVVTPRHALRKGERFTVTVSYKGKPGPVTDPDGSLDGWIPTDDGAFVAGEPQGAMTWFPANNHPKDKSSYDFTITVPQGRTAVANGVLLSQRTTHGKTTFRWRQSEPMAAYLATATVGKFKVEQFTTRNGIRVYNAVDSREAAAAAPVLKKLPSVLEWESKLFGPYPFRAAGSIVDHAPNVGYALETQSRPVYDRAPDLSTLVHENAHQWFGDSVSLTSWKDIWLNEGFATYAEWLYAEQHGGDSAQKTFDELYAKPASDELWEFPPGNPGSGANIFGTPVYARGAMTLHVLRTTVGDRAFFGILRAWAAGHRDGHGTTAQFERLAERVSGKKLDELFRTWLSTPGKPNRP